MFGLNCPTFTTPSFQVALESEIWYEPDAGAEETVFAGVPLTFTIKVSEEFAGIVQPVELFKVNVNAVEVAVAVARATVGLLLA